MKIATWNVNSIRARKERVLAWLERARPDAVCLQELKGEEDKFPAEDFEGLGYRAAIWGQKTYNGVALLSRREITDIERNMDDGVDDPQARLIAGTIDGVRLVSVYVPNGQTVGSDKYAYKTAWLDRFAEWLAPRLGDGAPTVVCGDFNIARDERDVDDPNEWEGTVLYNDEMRAALERLLDLGLVDAFRLHNDGGEIFSWWDYRQNSFRRNRGLRIDYVLVTRDLASFCTGCSIDRDERAGEKPSDHAPVITEFDL
jgi:exodeoxyribonuclease-3